ncbi:WD40 repeat domain-containing protein [Chloropicon primus]|uniref:WD40 repeat domain-containing protein n=2 Tax=Chloropicon primus TaxID=1764295 RepID=A0A5B8MQ30_9CHLO|nr:WD40 repeat domain-containing protein [Chloropicon primus]UPR00936.1 WD40 repeat domain-containing protein [Chloropicon primus]|eukprot:QDZ21715.1 WD40 repeat domain-containing protein [Chloropicon primus]
MLSRLRERETSYRGGRRIAHEVESERNRSLQLSSSRIFLCEDAFSGNGCSVMDLDPVEGRYLLAGGTDGTLCAFDVVSHYCSWGSGPQHEHKHLFRVPPCPPRVAAEAQREPRHAGHRGSVTSLQWYPVDTGLFLSAAKDKSVRLTDANELATVCSSRQDFEINCVAMPRTASGHCLIAIAARNPVIRVWDPRSNCITLNFAGHLGKEVTSLTWSSSSEWMLISGGSCGQIRLWDVRKANALLALDQYNTKSYSEGLTPLPDVEHLREKSGRTPHVEDVLYNKFNRNLQDWVNSKKLVKKIAESKRNDTATAHNSSVRLLLTSPDGLFLYSAAHRMSEMRKWDLSSGKNTLVHFELPTAGLKSLNSAALDGGNHIFVPHKTSIFDLDANTGKRYRKMNGHYDLVTGCVYNQFYGEVYTSSLDGNILLWEAEVLKSSTEGASAGEGQGNREGGENRDNAQNEDDWTTDEENEG